MQKHQHSKHTLTLMMLTLTFDGTASTCGINSCNSYVAFFEQSDVISGDARCLAYKY